MVTTALSGMQGAAGSRFFSWDSATSIGEPSAWNTDLPWSLPMTALTFAGARLGEMNFMGFFLGIFLAALIVIIVGYAITRCRASQPPRGRLCGGHAAAKRRMQRTAGRRPSITIKAQTRSRKVAGCIYKIFNSRNHRKSHDKPITCSSVFICRQTVTNRANQHLMYNDTVNDYINTDVKYLGHPTSCTLAMSDTDHQAQKSRWDEARKLLKNRKDQKRKKTP